LSAPPLSGRKARRAIDGVLLLDKPLGLSSNQALQKAKWLLRARKAGHAGTLDPAATGLLVICLGEATKLAGLGLEQDKTYEAQVELGVATDTGDAEGEVIRRDPFRGSDADIEHALASLRGGIQQVPPMHSALKREGQPLYVYARAGETVERTARAVFIHELTCLVRQGDRLRLRVACSKGTYIRVLAEQIGAALGCPAHLAGLRRTRAGPLGIEQAVTLEHLEALAEEARPGCLLSPEMLVLSMPHMNLTAAAEAALRQGQAVPAPAAASGDWRLHGPSGRLVALAEARDGRFHPRRILLNPTENLDLCLEEQDDSQIQ